jgi:hypothetical protein
VWPNVADVTEVINVVRGSMCEIVVERVLRAHFTTPNGITPVERRIHSTVWRSMVYHASCGCRATKGASATGMVEIR